MQAARGGSMISFPAPQPDAMRTADKDEHFVSHVYENCYDPFRQTLAEHHPLEAGRQHQLQAADTRQQLQTVAPESHHFPLPQPVDPLRFQQADPHQFQPPFPAADRRQFQQPGEFHGPDKHQFQVVSEARQHPHQHQFQAVPADPHQFQAPDGLPFPAPEFQPPADAHQLPGLNVRGVQSRRVAAVVEPPKPPCVRKFHKADREKLRRDKLNEQFTELAGVLDPDRPKNDKATILGDSVQTVRELRAEVKRLKTEHGALLEESRDLTQEKSELREEKSTLQSETDQLHQQLQQRLQMLVPWMSMDMSGMMAGSAYPYPVPMPGPAASRPPGNPHGPPGQVQQQHPLVPPASYMPAPSGPFPMHPALHAYAMFGNRHGDGSSPYMHYPHYPPPVGSHSHVERPYAQYPSPMQPPPGYLMQIQPPQSAAAVGPPFYRPYGPGMPAAQPPAPPSDQNRPNEVSHGGPPEADPSTSSQHASQENMEVQTTLQLQTGHSSANPERPVDSKATEGGAKAGSIGSGPSSNLEVSKREENAGPPQASNASTPLDLSLRTSSAVVAASSQSASSASSDVEGAGEGRKRNEEHSQALSKDIQKPNPNS